MSRETLDAERERVMQRLTDAGLVPFDECRSRRGSGTWHRGYLAITGDAPRVRDSSRGRGRQYRPIFERDLDDGTFEVKLPNGRYMRFDEFESNGWAGGGS